MQYDPSPGGGRRRRGAPPVACTCPKCGYEAEKVAGVPCRTMTCPKCGSPLVGK